MCCGYLVIIQTNGNELPELIYDLGLLHSHKTVYSKCQQPFLTEERDGPASSVKVECLLTIRFPFCQRQEMLSSFLDTRTGNTSGIQLATASLCWIQAGQAETQIDRTKKLFFHPFAGTRCTFTQMHIKTFSALIVFFAVQRIRDFIAQRDYPQLPLSH